jgi:hypothetical protein
METPGHIEVEYVEAEEYLELVRVMDAAEGFNVGLERVGQRTQNPRPSTEGANSGTVLQVPLQVDLEDVGRIFNRLEKFRKLGLKVTDICSSDWCQQQVAFSLSAALPKVTHCPVPFALPQRIQRHTTCWLITFPQKQEFS